MDAVAVQGRGVEVACCGGGSPRTGNVAEAPGEEVEEFHCCVRGDAVWMWVM